LLNLRDFASPYFGHDAFTHHALHVLDVPAMNCTEKQLSYSLVSVLVFHGNMWRLEVPGTWGDKTKNKRDEGTDIAPAEEAKLNIS